MIQKVVFPSFRESEYSQYDMRQLVSALEIRFLSLESNVEGFFPTSVDSDFDDRYAAAVHTHVVSDITDFAANVPSSIFDLDDVTGPISTGQGLVWSGAGFVAGSLGGSVSLNDLLDVNAPGPTDGQTLVWDVSTLRWIAADQSSGGVNALVDLTDTNLTGQLPGDLLFNAGSLEWQPTGGQFQWVDNQYIQLGNSIGVNWYDAAFSTVELLSFAPTGATGAVGSVLATIFTNPGDDYQVSTDGGITWTGSTNTLRSGTNGATAYSRTQNRWIRNDGGSGNYGHYSDDGALTWSVWTPNTIPQLSANVFQYIDDLGLWIWYIGGTSWGLYYSTDSINWTKSNFPNNKSLYTFAWSSPLQLGVAQGSTGSTGTWYSSDMVSWTAGTAFGGAAIIWLDNWNYFLSISGRDTFSSPTGTGGWTTYSQVLPSGFGPSGGDRSLPVAYSPELDIVVTVDTTPTGGNTADTVMWSDDGGKTWTLGTGYPAVGYSNPIWDTQHQKFLIQQFGTSGSFVIIESTDGKTWTSLGQPFAASSGIIDLHYGESVPANASVDTFYAGSLSAATVVQGTTVDVVATDVTITSTTIDINGVDPTIHLGEVTGAQSLALDVTAISNQTFVEADALDNTPIEDNTDGGLKKTTLSSITDGGFF